MKYVNVKSIKSALHKIYVYNINLLLKFKHLVPFWDLNWQESDNRSDNPIEL